MGKAAEAKVALEVAEEGGRVLGSEVYCRTCLLGPRIIDLAETATGKMVGIEVKSGNATRSAVRVEAVRRIPAKLATVRSSVA